MTPRSFRYDESGAVATITLDRPESLNALTFEVYRELTETFRLLDIDPILLGSSERSDILAQFLMWTDLRRTRRVVGA